nr:mechanosensitive ion channel domain-containing protein [uncultured Carboxylicivirga sp.]
MRFKYLVRIIVFNICLFYTLDGASQVNLFGKDTLETEVLSFSTANIGTESERTQALIRTIANKLESYKQKELIDSLTQFRLNRVADYRKNLSIEALSQLDFRQTDGLRNKLSNLKSQLEETRKLLATISTELNLNRDEIQGLISKWEKTLQNQQNQNTPQRVIERIRSNISDLNQLLSQINKQNNISLTRQDEITGAILFLDEILTNLDNTLERFRTQIYVLDSPPLWSALSGEEDPAPFVKKILNSLEQRRLSILSHKDALIHTTLIFVFLFVALLSLFIFLRKRLVHKDELMKCDTIKVPLLFLSNPFSSSLLFTSFFVLIFFPGLTPESKDLLKLLLIIPLLRLLPFVWPQLPTRYFYLSAGVFLLMILTDLLSSFGLLGRLLVLINSILSTVIFLSIWKYLRKNKEIKLKVFSSQVLLIGLISVGLSVIINVIGNNFLSLVLFNGAIALVFGGLIIFSTVEVFKSLFDLIVRHKLLVDLHIFRNYPDDILKWVFKILKYSALVFWIVFTSKSYLVYLPIYNWIESILTNKLELGSVSVSLGNIVAFAITLSATIYISRFIRFILEDEVYTHFEMPRGIGGAITMMVRLILLGFGFILAFGAADIDISNITIIFGALGVGIGFGLQNIFNNLVSGLILAFERPIQVGDVLQISSLNLMGEVKEIGIRASVIRTFDGAEVIVPNGNLISNEMVNWTLSDRRRRQEIMVGVSYGTDLKTVLEILERVVANQDGVLKDPAPVIIFRGFGDSSLDFRVMFWTHFDEGLKTISAVGIAIDNAFKEANITIPFPQRDLHIYPVNTESEAKDDSK